MFFFFTKLFHIKINTKFDANINKQSSWNDIWDDGDIKPLTFQEINTSSLNFSNIENVYIKNSFFQQITSNSHGGAISYYGSSRKRLLVEQSTFIECHAPYGSGIYFEYGDYYLNEICGLNCSSQSTAGIFGHFTLLKDTCKGTIVNSAFCFCISLSWGFTLLHYYGDFSFHLNNESLNHCFRGSAIGVRYLLSKLSTKLSYSSFTNSISDESTCILFEDSNTYFEVSYSNIINNKVNSNSNGLIWFHFTENGAIFTSCAILENKGYPIFYSDRNQTVTLNHCYTDFPADDDTMIKCPINIENIPEIPFTNNFNNVILGYCVGISLNTKKKPTHCFSKVHLPFHNRQIFF